MRIRVLFFAAVRDLTGVESASFEVDCETRVKDLLSKIEAKYPKTQGIWRAVRVAVNEEFASLQTILRKGDTLAIIPPVAGG